MGKGMKGPDIDLKELTDVREKGAPREGEPQVLDRRLFIQLLVFTGCRDTPELINDLEKSGLEAVLYEDLNDPTGVGLLTLSEDPGFFVIDLRRSLNEGAFSKLTFKPEFTMIGRTYALGHEADLEDWLVKRSRRIVSNPEWTWAVWYTLRRTGDFARLPREEQASILREHGMIGHAFGQAELGHDVRLTCFGLDRNDNDFVIGLIGKDLHPLSVLVQTMRRTRQTSTYIQQMGPFFVGKAVYQAPTITKKEGG
jgi:chlorite dismutase